MAAPTTSNRSYIAVDVLLEALGTAKSRSVPSPVDGTVKMMLVCMDTIVDGDNVVKGQINTTDITGATVTLKSTDTVNVTVKSAVPSAANTVARGQCLTAVTDGGGTVGQAHVTFLIEQDAS